MQPKIMVRIQNPVHLLAHNPHPQRIQGIVLAATGPEYVTEAPQVLFPDLVEDRPDRVLDTVGLQGRDPQGSVPPIGFRDPDSSRRLCSICSTMNSPMQVDQ